MMHESGADVFIEENEMNECCGYEVSSRDGVFTLYRYETTDGWKRGIGVVNQKFTTMDEAKVAGEAFVQSFNAASADERRKIIRGY
jgi:hypothetical protein